MKLYFTLSLMLLTLSISNGQNGLPLDTIYANDTKNVALFFPEPIRQGITGSENFVFTFNREKEQHLGLLQAKPGQESNLLVISNNGAIFSYIIKYCTKPLKLNYFISESNSIGNENRVSEDEPEIEDIPKQPLGKHQYYERFCSYLLNRQEHISLRRKRKSGIVLHLGKIVFDKEELYFVIQIENNSSMDYDLNFLDIFVETRKKGKKKSLQRIDPEPLYSYQVPSKVQEGTQVWLVYVLPKFSISNERRVVLELNEKNGERDLKLKLSHRYINNPH
ncbi:DUF4138 domain-containing protein [Luteirhabdus pelagi]|uniref:DUF4138 domain-containing protein n=1 Tax=Luteirhabdus pelagi TaxID=2792783 RepID=UPI00193A60B1|nr:DUF4138 domain-containing protein [Luteirhabdus pelagi]